MKLRKRVLLAISLTMLTSGIGVYMVAVAPMAQSFNELEMQRAHEDVRRVDEAFTQISTDIHRKSVDWASWDDAYRFVQKPTKEFISSNLQESSLISLDLDLILFMSPTGELVYSSSSQRQHEHPLLSGKDMADQIREHNLLERGARPGIVVMSGAPVLVSIRPIRRSTGVGESPGWLVFAKYVTSPTLQTLKDVTRQDVSFIDPRSAKASTALAVLDGSRLDVTEHDHATLDGYSVVPALSHQPALIIKTSLPRKVSMQGLRGVQAMAIGLLWVGTMVALVILLVIDRSVLSRLNRLSKGLEQIHDIKRGGMVSLPGGDELAYLALRINDMLSALSAEAQSLMASEEQLRYQNEHLEQIVSERTKEIEHQAFHDKLTGLPNRALYMDRLDIALDKARRNRSGMATIFVDLDNFKLVNDSLGHGSGDELLRSVSRVLLDSVRPGDTVARLGGDEFTIIIEDLASVEAAVEVARRILAQLRRPIGLGDSEAFASASLGIAYTDSLNITSETLLRNADTAMYRAKNTGKSNYVVFDETMEDYALERLELETSLRKALQNHEICVWYQPTIDLKTKQMVGAEALARWLHPTRGLVSPGQFIPIAEDTGLIIPIGYWVLEESCRQAKAWMKEYQLSEFILSVNLSGKQLQREDVVDRVRDILFRTQFPPEFLKIEITESVLMHDRDDVVEKMNKLKDMGIKLALDDFGTGYSSLATLRSFPIDTLKIDRAFICRLGSEEGANAIVEAILAVARTMHMDVTGEGIETGLQEQIVQGMGCTTGQGYLYDKPLKPEEFSRRLNPARREAA